MARSKRETADRLHSAAIHLLRALRAADAESGVSPARLSALSVLVFGGDCSLTELAEAEGVRAPTMTRLVQGLEAESLVERAADPSDGRATILRATRRGRTLLEKARGRRIDVFESLIAGANTEELTTLQEAAELLERITATARSQ
jgi:DNA-binding MarR family transcriptional regulator